MRRRTLSPLVLMATALAAAAGGYLAGLRRHVVAVGPVTNVTAPSIVRQAYGAPPVGATENAAANRSAVPWSRRWDAATAKRRTPRTERAMATLLRELASRDHDRALQLALAEPNWKLRGELRSAVLRGWAEAAPGAAAAYALGLRADERAAAFAAVFAGAAGQPDEVVAVAGSVCKQDPDRAFDYTKALIATLGEEGHFDVTARFLAGRPASPQRLEEADNAFSLWAEHCPAEAAQAANAITDPELRAAAFRGAVVGWSQADPAALANYAATLPPGDGRSIAIANAVPRWVERDPVAAATWMVQRDPDPDFDMGVVAIATVPTLVTQRPELAVSLAQTIADAPLRAITVRNLVSQWAQGDSDAAAHYVETSSAFDEADRAAILGEIRQHRE